MNEPKHIEFFEARRGFLLGLAYRILGSYSDAEDAVQDVFLKWRAADGTSMDNPSAWLTTACTRCCLDHLKSSERTRLTYVGTWLPEPIHTASTETPENALELSSSLSTAFLLLLERLTPRERAAYLLHEIFDLPYPEVAAALDTKEAACRKLVSRARNSLGKTRAGYLPPRDRQEELLSAFREAVSTGATQRLTLLLSEDIILSADGGGKAQSIERTLHGVASVTDFIGGSLRDFWRPYEWKLADINDSMGVILLENGRIAASVSFGYREKGLAAGIYIMRNPEKLAHLAKTIGSLS